MQRSVPGACRSYDVYCYSDPRLLFPAGVEVSEADAASFKAVLDTKVGCQSVANNIGLACRDFL
jgi:hypothetical protein